MRPHYVVISFFACLLSVTLFSQTITPKKSGQYTVSEHYQISNHTSPVKLTVKTVCTGTEADDIRKTLSSKSRANLSKDYLKYYAEVYPGVSASKALVVQYQNKKNEVTIIEQYSIPEFFERDSISGAYEADFYSDYVSNVLPKLSAQPKKPLYVGWADIDHSIILDMPGGWNIDMESKELKNNTFLFRYDVLEADEVLTLHYQFKYLKDVVAVDKYKEFASQITKLRDKYLSYSISHFPDTLPFYPNRGLIVFGLCLIVCFGGLAYLIYYRVTSQALYSAEPIPLGGWLFIVVLGLLATVYNEVKTIVDLKYLDLNTWDFYSARQSSTFYKTILTTKVFTGIYVIFFALFCILLMVKQRDILPRIISIYFATSAILMTVIYILFTRLYGEDPSSINELTYIIVSSFIGMYYFKTAERVKNTFVVRVKQRSNN